MTYEDTPDLPGPEPDQGCAPPVQWLALMQTRYRAADQLRNWEGLADEFITEELVAAVTAASTACDELARLYTIAAARQACVVAQGVIDDKAALIRSLEAEPAR